MKNGTITYYLSEPGRKASLLAGGTGTEVQQVTGELTSENIDLFRVSTDGSADFTLDVSAVPERSSYGNREIRGWEQQRFDAPVNFDGVIDAAREIARQRAQIEADEQPRLAAWGLEQEQKNREKEAAEVAKNRATQTERFSELLQPGSLFRLDPEQIYCHNWTASIDKIKPEHPQYAEFRAQLELLQTEREATARATAQEHAERERLKADFCAEWIAVNGTDNQRARFAEGLLPADELETALKEAAFSAFDFPRYRRIPAKDVRATCTETCTCGGEYDSCSVNFQSEDASDATAAEFATLELIRAALVHAPMRPAEATLRLHTGTCSDSDCDPDEGVGRVTRKGILVKLRFGPFTFHRLFAV